MTNEKQANLRDIGFVITLLLNFGGLVWGVAKMDGAINELRRAMASLSVVTQNLTENFSNLRIDHEARIQVLEDRVRGLRDDGR